MPGNTSSPFGQKPSGFTQAFGNPQQPIFGQSAAPSFGASNPTPFSPSSGGFGTPTQPTFGASSNVSTFGATNQPTFGAPTSQSTFAAPSSQPSFGAPSATPAFGAPSATPAFGAPATTPAFGAPATTPAFGAPATTPAFGAPSATPAFGTPSLAPAFGTQNAAPVFGAAATPGFTAPPTTNTFGAATSAPTFGTPTATPSFGATSLSFGTNQQPPAFNTTTTQASGFQFGQGSVQAGFGATSLTTTPSLTTSTSQAPISFSAPATTTGLSFGTTKPGTISFNTPTTTSSITFGTSLTPKTVTTQGSTGFTFGTSTATTTPATSTGINTSLGLASFTAPSLSLGTAIGGKSMLTITGNTATPLYGSKTADLQAGRSSAQLPPKLQNVPSQVVDLIESFKSHMNQQKHLCLEVSRATLKPISKISNDAENIKRSVMKLERAVNKNKLMESKLKEETSRALADIEIAQKAMDVPGGFPSENSIIFDYFIQLATKFQQQVFSLRVELESTEKNILCELNPTPFTPQELSETMRRLYECFVALAGKFQFVHAQISNLKVQHLELRRKKLDDCTDIFNKKISAVSRAPFESSHSNGPSPFTGTQSAYYMLTAFEMKPNVANLGSIPPAPTTQNTSFFNNTLNQTQPNPNLFSTPPQSPIPGSKRGKR